MFENFLIASQLLLSRSVPLFSKKMLLPAYRSLQLLEVWSWDKSGNSLLTNTDLLGFGVFHSTSVEIGRQFLKVSSVPYFHQVWPRNWTRVLRLGCKCLTHWAILQTCVSHFQRTLKDCAACGCRVSCELMRNQLVTWLHSSVPCISARTSFYL